jgi:hypothetical protein
MSKKVDSDLEKMNKDRRRAEEEYLDAQTQMLEIRRIQRDGINNVEELVLYVGDVIQSVQHAEDVARQHNNHIVYSEAIGIRREMSKLFDLILKDGTAAEQIDGTEEAHRVNNEGEEGYS